MRDARPTALTLNAYMYRLKSVEAGDRSRWNDRTWA